MLLLAILLGAVLFMAAGVLTAFAPDFLAMAILAVMLLVLLPGYIFGIYRPCRYCRSFANARTVIREAVQEHHSSVWLFLQETGTLFANRGMDAEFREYTEQVDQQMKTGQLTTDIEDFYNVDLVRLKTRQNLVDQISGTMTGLGLLGTFVGLVTGISGIGFSSVEAAVSSIQVLLSGIQTAFYTSIAGVILSILFNLFHNAVWNVMESEIGLFIREFHQYVLPSTNEVERRLTRREMHQILKHLERIGSTEAFSLGKPSESGKDNEHILMPQILNGMRNGEFIILLQPGYDLGTRKVIFGEALVRWNHGKMGLVSPGVFLPILEKNGAITQLDRYVWEKAAETIHSWTEEKRRLVPLVVNVSKTDILSLDVVSFFSSLIQKYNILPKNLYIDIAMEAYVQAPKFTTSIQEKLQKLGFRTIMDGFDGDVVSLSSIEYLSADAIELDLRQIEKNNRQGISIASAFAYAKAQKLVMTANGIETMEQLSQLRKNGCTEGKGYYFSKAVSVEDFERLLEE